jgi:hypothetical protein
VFQNFADPGPGGLARGQLRREPRAAARPPAEVAIVEAHDATTVGHADGLINEVFGAHSAPGSLLTPGCLDERFRVWVGYEADRPVTTAAAYIADGFVGV